MLHIKTASKLSSSLTAFLFCRHIKAQNWPKPQISRSNQVGCSTVDSNPLRNWTFLQSRMKEENSMSTMSVSVKRKTHIKALTMPSTQRDDYNLLSPQQQIVLVWLHTGYDRLNRILQLSFSQIDAQICQSTFIPTLCNKETPCCVIV